jgi:hypothetical protein
MSIPVRDRVRAARDASPVFIVGVPRSGTTLLYRTLLQHSSFKPGTAPTVLVETKVFQDPGERNPHLKTYMLDNEEEYQAFLHATRHLRALRRILERFPGPRCHQLASPGLRARCWRLHGYDRQIQLFFYHALRARSARRLLEKTPEHAAYVPEILTTFPHASFVWIHRHPVDVYSSYRRRGETEVEAGLKEEAEDRWLQVTPDEFCRRHRRTLSACRRAMTDPGVPFLSVRYEDFVADPDRVLEKVCAFLGEPFEPECLRTGHQDIRDPRDPLLSSGIRNRTKDWRSFIGEDEARFIEQALRDDLDDLGYERYTESSD